MLISKPISKSILTHGISLSLDEQKLFPIKLEPREKYPIKIFYGEMTFDATFRSVGFDRFKNPNHVPICRIEYRRDLKDLYSNW